MHLHVLRSVGDGHGPQGEIPEHLNFENLEEVGTREVEVNYPEERKTESVARLCPYCGKPFKGKHGVLIHLGQIEGRKNHPANASEVHEPDDFPVVELDEAENVVAVVEGRMPSSAGNWPYEESIPVERVYRLIAELLAEGDPEMAARARTQLLAID
ncbi:hypothetical protein [Haloferax volcanii]|uniref:hypothetical protein n=1 Tax=Haloferax volcanii TaxID=2246 RepID=UPI0023DA1E4B|nr:hypothetical protein [Haloferax lucentense]